MKTQFIADMLWEELNTPLWVGLVQPVILCACVNVNSTDATTGAVQLCTHACRRRYPELKTTFHVVWF